MGADLIGYLVKGPKEISAAAWDAAEAKLVARLEPMWLGAKVDCPDCGEPIDCADPDEFEYGCPACGSDSIKVMAELEDRDSVTQFMAKLRAWPPGARDVASRPDPDNDAEILVFAGEMSWGDSPCGYGYAYLRDLVLSGVGTDVGVR